MDLFNDDHSTANDHQLFVVGSIRAIFFESQDNFYKVLSVQIKERNFDWDADEIVLVGSFGDVDQDTEYRFYGKLVDHYKYGKQFSVDHYESETPTTAKGLTAYLASDDFPGIGAKTAEKIVTMLGTDLIPKILNDSSVLDPIGLSAKQKKTLVSGVQNHDGVEQIIIGLNGYGFGSNLSAKIYNCYKEKTLSIIKENPYQLVEDINGISFKKADRIASELGFENNSPGRLRAGIMTALDKLALSNGGTYTNVRSLVLESLELLNGSRDGSIGANELGKQVVALAREQKIVGEDNRVYLKKLYDAEWEIADNLNRLNKAGDDTQATSDEQVDKMINRIELENQIDYDESQINALKMAMKSSVFLLTGGPGTGKTTIIKGILSLYAKINDLSLSIKDYDESPYPFLLAAPTGRAAKRMRETTGAEASTIHKLLGLNINNESQDDDFESREVTGQILIIDEMSMVDTYLFRTLIKAIPEHMKVILVGDRDQLPSVGPGQVFSDLLESQTLPSLELNTIHRQDDKSTIIELAHEIKNGRLPSDFTTNQSDRSFIECNAKQVQSVIKQVIGRAHQRGFKSTELQVLAPMYKGPIGVNNLNQIVQAIMNPKTSPDQKEVTFRDVNYRIGDKVLQLVNSPENNVFNGDIGLITSIITDGKNSSHDKLVVAFDDAEVTYQRRDWIQITLAYCTTIHKAQGSEFKMVLLPIVPQYTRMLRRNLLYTAITRASKLLVLAGDINSFKRCVQDPGTRRNTSLAERLIVIIKGSQHDPISNHHETKVNEQADRNNLDVNNGQLHKNNQSEQMVLTNELLNSHSIDPMIGMTGISPDQFN
ncbi:ATP-dependent RecD-like DNA helicase [Nicoliella spurrieriana]|uniref:ATP-dependent RecD2 DNA helicase n=2 Tax=Nicoliella spurrieriana TaxID=2925830 RepID=A0A976RTE2_9LACO|nr:ATP-dependent RecD-like DNA helicase [Nicoliella spurrieriana]UQS87505.1 ATP-dependent RecD-like DNA helicase [Nicoliella spurrieriana]